ncbi:type II toxin-antitoxin system VapC family toxin [Thermodesulfobacteriota bacterium]
MPNRFVLDSYALLGYLQNENFSDRIESALINARIGLDHLYLHAIHLGEAYYIVYRKQGPKIADMAYSRIKAFPITLISRIDEELLLSAARFKAEFPISFADAFAAAMSVIYKCHLLTGDSEFKRLENANRIRIEWL